MKIEKVGKYEFDVESETTPGKKYRVTTKGEPTCDCKGFSFNEKCKHIDGVLKLQERDDPGPDENDGSNDEKTVQKDEETQVNGKKLVIPEKYIRYMSHKNKKTGEITITPFIRYAGLMHLARKEGFRKLHATLIQIPNKENEKQTICSGYLLTNAGQEFKDVGDADVDSVNNSMIHPHNIRMASTRAKARVLRDWLEVDMVCVEELSDEKEDALIEGKITNEQKAKLKALYARFDLPDEKKIDIWTWTLNLDMGDGDYVIKKLGEMDSFDYSDFVTLKDEIATRNKEGG